MEYVIDGDNRYRYVFNYLAIWESLAQVFIGVHCLAGCRPVRIDQGGCGSAGPDDEVEGRRHPEDAAGSVIVVMLVQNLFRFQRQILRVSQPNQFVQETHFHQTP